MAEEKREPDDTAETSKSEAGRASSERPLEEAPVPSVDKDALQEAISPTRRAAGPEEIETESLDAVEEAEEGTEEEPETDPV